ncbi:MAG TPA: hypothetical protein VHH73_12005 [Verrucomicrobiae bacterium]|nr:hypothetical protein [Verrucomicrobiae bacterium]
MKILSIRIPGYSPWLGTKSAGFGRLDLLVVIAGLALLVETRLARWSHARASAQATTCLSNHRQLARAWELYHQDNNGRLIKSVFGVPLLCHIPK